MSAPGCSPCPSAPTLGLTASTVTALALDSSGRLSATARAASRPESQAIATFSAGMRRAPI